MFTESNINPRYVIFYDGKKVPLSECIKNPKGRNIFIALMHPVRLSSYVFSNIKRSSLYIAIMISSNLKTAIGGFDRFLNFLCPEDNPFGSTTSFRSLNLAKIFCVFF